MTQYEKLMLRLLAAVLRNVIADSKGYRPFAAHDADLLNQVEQVVSQ